MASRIPQSLIASATHNSLVPVLYQTSTLSAVPWRYPTRMTLKLRVCPWLQYPFSTSMSPGDESARDAAQTATDSPGDASNPTTTGPEQESPIATAREEDHISRSSKSYIRRRAESVSHRTVSKKQPPKPLRTMTQSEKRVFGELLQKLGDTSLNQQPPQKQQLPFHLEDILDPQESGEHAQKQDGPGEYDTEISSIFETAAQETRGKEPILQQQQAGLLGVDGKSLSKSESPKPISEAEGRRLLKIQDRLRRFKYSDVDISENNTGDQMPMETAIKVVVQREVARIESALLAAIDSGMGDAGIWDVCEKQIFSMPAYLESSSNMEGDGEEDYKLTSHLTPEQEVTMSQLSTTPAEKSEEKHQEGKEKEKTASTPDLEIPPFIPTKPVINALYPKTLFIAFRLLSSHFPSSLLIERFRATIRSQSRMSSIVGSSTSLYNELINLSWRDCGNLHNVISLLHEMEITGVEADEKTMALLHGIVRQRESDVRAFRRQRKDPEALGAQRTLWWDTGPNRRSFRELAGPGGWIERLEERMRRKKLRVMVGSVSRSDPTV